MDSPLTLYLERYNMEVIQTTFIPLLSLADSFVSSCSEDLTRLT